VLVRLQHSHIRIGTFQRLATLGEDDNLRKLTAYCLRHYYADASADPATLLGHVTARAARLAASYIAAGFVHGVLNSDNIAITAQSFDYGPWRFTPIWDGAFTAAYFDHAGLYAFARQPEAIHWDVVQLAIALRRIEEAEPLTERLETFPHLFQQALRDAIFARLGLRTGELATDMALVGALEETLSAAQVPLDLFWFDWRGGRRPAGGYDGFDELAALIARHDPVPDALDHPYWFDPAPCSMLIDEVEAIWTAIDERDDWAPLYAKLAAIRRMGEAYRADQYS
jgi:uncharacterized protein YdiU (UPF0061 family)